MLSALKIRKNDKNVCKEIYVAQNQKGKKKLAEVQNTLLARRQSIKDILRIVAIFGSQFCSLDKTQESLQSSEKLMTGIYFTSTYNMNSKPNFLGQQLNPFHGCLKRVFTVVKSVRYI